MILLDTHALVWWVSDPKRIPKVAARAIAAAVKREEMLAVSSYSVWEIALLGRTGRLKLSMDVEVWLERVERIPNLAFFPVDNRIARRSVGLTLDTRDPADRIIVATAMEHGASIVTADERMHAYGGVATLWD